MVRVGGVDNVELGNGGRGSPSDVFSPNILQMEKDKERKKNPFYKWFAFIAIICCVVFMIATIVLGITLGVKLNEKNQEIEEILNQNASNSSLLSWTPNKEQSIDNITIQSNKSFNLKWPEPSGSLHATYKRAAIATDHGLCSEIGRDVLLEGGNAVDATIASLFCIGVVNPQSSGIGGGFLMTLYNTTTQRCTTIDAREAAPLSANSTMFSNSTNDALNGYRSIATPGEIHGAWTIFQKFGSGRVPWKRLLAPSVRLARQGFPISSNLASVLQQKEDDIEASEDMRKVFVDPRTGRVYEEGDILHRERLAELLDELADAADPVQLFYKEGIAQTIAAEIKDNGGHITVEDLAAYETKIHDTPLESEVLPDELVMCGPPPPSSFAISQVIIGIMSEFYKENKVDLDDPLVYHRLIEVEKFAYAQRTNLGDVEFVKNARSISKNMTKPAFSKWIASLIMDQAQPMSYYSRDLTGHVSDHGTSHISSMDHDGNAVSVTSTINQLFV